MKKIIILRGNSGSGKTTVARALQKKFGYNTMMILQDEIRRNILWVKDGVDTKALPLMIELLKYGYEHCDVVILEGIMYDEWYSTLFKLANELYGLNVYAYYFDIPFEETVRRHNMRNKSQEFDEEAMRKWWREKDFSSVLEEQTITCEMDADSIVERIYLDLLGEN
ncbi:MAG: kinase [Lachnospira sp.]